jgi:stage V sporulation protein R
MNNTIPPSGFALRKPLVKPSLPQKKPAQPINAPVNFSARKKTTPPSASALNALAAYNQSRLKAQPKFGGSRFEQGDIQLGTHPTDSPYLNKLHEWEQKVWKEATKPRPDFPNGWLNPMDTVFQVSTQVDLMEAAARSGFPSRYRHWAWGQDFNEQYQRQRFGLGRLYEMVINTSPSYAFLYDRNPVYAQKVVMAHVLGHTDFFKNNIMYSESNRNMVRVMADNKAAIEKYYQDPRLARKAKDTGVHPVEDFLNKFNALEWLVDMNALAPPPLSKDLPANEGQDNHYKNAGLKTEALGVAPWMQDFLYTSKDWEKYKDKSIEEDDIQHAKTLKQPTRDVLGFLVENAEKLAPWQRDMLGRLREESYYFVPQVRTKLMNEGWATFWHHKLMNDCPDLANEAETTDISKMMAGVEAPNPNGINPYQVGYGIFQNIYKRAAYGLDDFDTEFKPNKVIRYEDLNDRIENRQPNEKAGLDKVLEVRKYYNDVEFIRQFFTPEVAEELGMVITKEKEEWNSQLGQRVTVKYVESDDFKQVKEQILSMYQNAFPTLNLVDANHNQQGELLLKHENPVQDLDLQDTKYTMGVINEFWGRPVNLDTIFEVEQENTNASRRPHFDPWSSWGPREPEVEFKRQPVRLTYKDGKMSIFTLDKAGKPEKNVTDRYF